MCEKFTHDYYQCLSCRPVHKAGSIFFFLIFKATVHRELPKRLEPDMLECWIHLTLWLGHSDNPNSGWSTQDTWLLVVPWSDIQSTRIQK